MSSGLMRITTSVLLLAALSFSAWAQVRDPSPDVQHLNPLETIKTSDIRSFAERPLFAQTRRPADVAEETNIELEKPTESAPAFVLLGVTSGPEGSVARITKADGKDAHSLRTGEAVDGWTVKSIAPSSVTLAQGDKVTVLTIFRENSEVTDEEEPAESTSGIVFGAEDPIDADDPPKKVRMISPK